MTAQYQKDAALKAMRERREAVSAAATEAADVLGAILKSGDRFDRAARAALTSGACPSVTARNLGDVVAELRERGELVAGRERGAPLYWKRTPKGVEAV